MLTIDHFIFATRVLAEVVEQGHTAYLLGVSVKEDTADVVIRARIDGHHVSARYSGQDWDARGYDAITLLKMAELLGLEAAAAAESN